MTEKMSEIDKSQVILKGVKGDTEDGEIIITLPKSTGKYSIDIIPLIDSTFPFYELESRSQAILEELLDIVDNDERYGYRDSIMDLEDNLAIAMMLIQKYVDMSDVRNGYKRKDKNIHDKEEIETHRRGGDIDVDRVVRVLTK